MIRCFYFLRLFRSCIIDRSFYLSTFAKVYPASLLPGRRFFGPIYVEFYTVSLVGALQVLKTSRQNSGEGLLVNSLPPQEQVKAVCIHSNTRAVFTIVTVLFE